MTGPRSLGWRLAAAFSAVTAALAVLLTLFYQRQAHELLDRESKERTSTLAQHVAATSVLGALARSEELLASPLDGAMSQADVDAVAVYDAAGALVSARSRRGVQAAARLDPTLSCRPCLGARGRLRWIEPLASTPPARGEDRELSFDGPPRPASEAGAGAGWVVLDVNTTARAAAERRIGASGLLIGAIALVVALVVAFAFTQRLTSPLRALADASREIGKGHWDAKLPQGATSEIAQLSADFRAMAEALAALDHENARYRGHLEEMVASRTSELQEAYQHVKAMSEAKDQFVATVSHDFRSPLAIILSAVQTILSDPAMAPEVRRQFLDRAERQCKRLGALVNDLLDLARIENREARFEPLSLAEVVAECADGAKGSCEDRHVALVVEPPEAPVIAEVDRALVQRALANLLDNAVKFTPPRGRVTVRLRRDDGEATISVSDTGPGIPEEEREHVFERFYQGRHGQALGRGSGLGLAIVAGVARRHGGRVTVTGAGPGATFDLSLPLARRA